MPFNKKSLDDLITDAARKRIEELIDLGRNDTEIRAACLREKLKYKRDNSPIREGTIKRIRHNLPRRRQGLNDDEPDVALSMAARAPSKVEAMARENLREGLKMLGPRAVKQLERMINLFETGGTIGGEKVSKTEFLKASELIFKHTLAMQTLNVVVDGDVLKALITVLPKVLQDLPDCSERCAQIFDLVGDVVTDTGKAG